MISKADLDSVCQWAYDIKKKKFECVHGVVVKDSYLWDADVGKLRGRHKTEAASLSDLLASRGYATQFPAGERHA